LQKSTSATRNTPTESNCLSKHWLRPQTRKWKRAKAAGGKGGASIVPAKDHFEWPYVVLLVGLVVMVAAALHLLSTWVAYVIFAILWIGFAIWPKNHR